MLGKTNLPFKNDVEQWTVETVAVWLQQMELQDCSVVFLRAGIDGHKMLNLQESELSNFSSLSNDSRRKIFTLCQDIKRGHTLSKSHSRNTSEPDLAQNHVGKMSSNLDKTSGRRCTSPLDDDLYLLPISISNVGDCPPATPARPSATLIPIEKTTPSHQPSRTSSLSLTNTNMTSHFWAVNGCRPKPPEKLCNRLEYTEKNTPTTEPHPRLSSRKDIADEGYYHNITRDEAKSVLNRASLGDFLIRPSRHSDDHKYTLCIKNRQGMTNLPIRRKLDGKFSLGSEKANGQTFNSIQEIINHHKREEIKLANKSACILANPITNREN